MFERYTEEARRVIFFARYEASRFGSTTISTEHLLLGLLREDKALRARLPIEAREQMREQIAQRAPRGTEHLSISVDLPLSHNAKRALAYANEDCAALQHTFIDA